MKNKINKFRKLNDNKGFTLIETLLVVAIIVILLGLATVGVLQYMKTMHQLEMDEAAKEIFVAAQNHLSMAESQGYLERSECGKEDTSSENYKDDGIYYYVVDGSSDAELEDTDSYLNLMLPYGSVDEEVRTGGSYVILYQKETARVIEVYYASEGGRYGHTFDEAEYTAMVNNFGEDGDDTQHKKDRLSYGEKIQAYLTGTVDNDDAIIGYYGGTENSIDIGTFEKLNLKAPSVEVTNQDQLVVKVTDNNTGNEEAALKLIIHGEKSGNDKEVIVKKSKSDKFGSVSGNVSLQNTGDSTYAVVLDDITSESNHFCNLFCIEDGGLIPGENITVKAVAYSNTSLSNIAYSGTTKTNSLFADLVSDGTAVAEGTDVSAQSTDTSETNTIKVAYTRHLENLSNEISGYSVSQLNVDRVEQTKDISFLGEEDNAYGEAGFTKNVGGKGFQITTYAGTKETENCFRPVVYGTGTQAIAYYGNNHSITGIKVNTGSEAGLFASLYEGSKISNLELVNFDIKSTGDNAGTLAGKIDKTSVYGVLAHNGSKTARANETLLEVCGADNVGGLVGEATGGSTINLSAAAVYVRGGTLTSASGDNLGGLAGKIDASTVKNSYSGGHTDGAEYKDDTASYTSGRVNVIGGSSSYAGGFAGTISGDSSISNCYSTCSVEGGTPSGFAGQTSGGSVSNCYATGQVKASSSTLTNPVSTQAFVGSNSGTTFKGNYYITNVSDNDGTKDTDGITGVSGNDADAEIVIEEEDRALALAYDPTLAINYEGKYYFKTISMLNSSAVTSDTSLIAKSLASYHYGDWEVPEVQKLDFKLINEDRLYLNVYSDPEEGELDKITLAVKGRSSGKTEIYIISLESGKVGTIIKHYLVDGGTTTEVSSNYNFQITSKKCTDDEHNGDDVYTVVLDDITTQYSHFCELFPYLTAGENISVYVEGGTAGTEDVILKMSDNSNVKTENSLFALCKNGEIGEANIAYIRQLQNLDPQISNVDASVTKAYLKDKNLNWTAAALTGDFGSIGWSDADTKIYNKNSAYSVDEGFYGIYNKNLTLFDGGNCSLQNFLIYGAPGTISTTGQNNAGLFRYVDNSGLTVQNLCMDSCTISTSAGHAGAIGAETESGSSLTIQKSLVKAPNTSGGKNIVKTTASSDDTSSDYSAGGLVGHACGTVKITNSAATIVVSAAGSAGGLVGKSDADLTIENSYAGGHTESGVYSTANYNVTSTASNAGGIIGTVGSGEATVTKASSAASVSAASGYAGGIIGQALATSTLTNAYTVAPVANVQTGLSDTWAGNNNAGAFAGNSSNISCSDCYYLIDVYTEQGKKDYEEVEDVAQVGSGSAITGVEPTYYFVEGGLTPIAGLYGDGSDVAQESAKYDTSLTGEYPFMVYPQLPVFGQSSGEKKSYVGDWEPSYKKELEQDYKIDFTYIDPLSSTNEEKAVEDTNLNEQKLVTNKENKVLEPYTSNIPGYKVSKWTIYKKNDNNTRTAITVIDNDAEATASADPSALELEADDKGILTLPKEYCVSNLEAVATFEREPGTSVVYFRYGNNGIESSDGELMCKGQAVKNASGIAENTVKSLVNIPSRDCEGYTFEGWFYDSACTQQVDFDKSTKTIDAEKDITYYAKYQAIEYYTVTIDFLYQVDDDIKRPITSTPLYSMSNLVADKQASYNVKYAVGKTFNENIELPDFGISTAGITLGKYQDLDGAEATLVEVTDDNKDSLGISLSNDNKSINVITDETSHYAVVYTTNSSDQWKYKIRYKMKNTKANTSVRSSADLVYDEDATCEFFYKDSEGEDKVYSISEGKELQISDIPGIESVIGSDYEGWERVTDSVPLRSSLEQDEDGVYIVEIEYERNNYSISFNTDGGKIIQTKTLAFGQPLSDAKPADPTREGYIFETDKYADGWKIYESDDSTKTHKYNWSSTMPYKNLVALAHWIPGESEFTVIFWKQSVFDHKDLKGSEKTYDYADTYSTKLTGKTGSTPVVDENILTMYNEQTRNEDASFYHFYYARNDASDKKIAGDGSTVVNVYYDRELLTYDFYISANTRYTSGNGGTYVADTGDDCCYGLVDEKYVYLHKDDDGNWVYQKTVTKEIPTSEEEEYKGTVYYKTSKEADGDYYIQDGNGFTKKSLYYNEGKWWQTKTTKEDAEVYTNPVTLWKFTAVAEETISENGDYYEAVSDGKYKSLDENYNYYDGKGNAKTHNSYGTEADATEGFYKSVSKEYTFNDADKVTDKVYTKAKASASSGNIEEKNGIYYVLKDGKYTKTNLFEGNGKFYLNKLTTYSDLQTVYTMNAVTAEGTLGQKYTNYYKAASGGYYPANVWYCDGSAGTRAYGKTTAAAKGYYSNEPTTTTEYDYSNSASYDGYQPTTASKTDGYHYVLTDGEYVKQYLYYNNGNFYNNRTLELTPQGDEVSWDSVYSGFTEDTKSKPEYLDSKEFIVEADGSYLLAEVYYSTRDGYFKPRNNLLNAILDALKIKYSDAYYHIYTANKFVNENLSDGDSVTVYVETNEQANLEIPSIFGTYTQTINQVVYTEKTLYYVNGKLYTEKPKEEYAYNEKDKVSDVKDMTSYSARGNTADTQGYSVWVTSDNGETYENKTLYHKSGDEKWYDQPEKKTYTVFSGNPITVYTPTESSGTSDGTYIIKSGNYYVQKSLVYNGGDGYTSDGSKQATGLYLSRKEIYSDEVTEVYTFTETSPSSGGDGDKYYISANSSEISDSETTLYYNENDTAHWYTNRTLNTTYDNKIDVYKKTELVTSNDSEECWVLGNDSAYFKTTPAAQNYVYNDGKASSQPIGWYEKKELSDLDLYSDEYTGTVYEGEASYNGNSKAIKYSDVSSKTCYGLIDGEAVSLTVTKDGSYAEFTYLKEGTEKVEDYENVIYTGTRYKQDGFTSPLTGLYGQPITMYGYHWPYEYGWRYVMEDEADYKDFISTDISNIISSTTDMYGNKGYSYFTNSTGMSFLGEFLVAGKTGINFYFRSIGTATNYINFFCENINETYNTTYTDRGSIRTDTPGLTFTDKYIGFQHVLYITSNLTGWKDTSGGASTDSDMDDNNLNVADQTAKIDPDKTDQLSVKFKRLSYGIEFYDNTDLGNPLATFQLKYEDTLTNGLTGKTLPTLSDSADGSMEWDGKYYKDPACTVVLNFDTTQIPAGGESGDTVMAVYMHRVLKTFTVKFYSDSSCTEDKLYSGLTFKRQYGKTLEDSPTDSTESGTIADSNGGVISALTPADWTDSSGTTYEFDGWYIKDSSGNEVSFPYSYVITTDCKVYAKWKEKEKEEEPGFKTVYVNHVCGDTVLKEQSFDNQKVGTSYLYYALESIEKNGVTYRPQITVVKHKVKDSDVPEDNTVTINYSKINSWTYTIEYYICFESVDATGMVKTLPATAQTDNGSSLVSQNSGSFDFTQSGAFKVYSETKDSYETYETVEFKMPSALTTLIGDGYVFDHGEYGSETNTYGKFIVIHPDAKTGTSNTGTAVVKFYLIPDWDKISIAERYVKYDGTSQDLSGRLVNSANANMSLGNAGVTYNVYNLYNYYKDGEAISGDSVKDAGTYDTAGYVVYQITGDMEGKGNGTYYFLVYKDISQKLKLRIDRREITVTSESASKTYDGTALVRNSINDITIGGDGLVSGQSILPVFSPEAFRLTSGTSENIFDCVAGNDATNLDNYLITTEFGTLTVN